MSLIQTHSQKILKDHGLHPLEPEKWYSLQSVLSAFEIIRERIGPSTMKAIGRKVPEHTRFPPNVHTLGEALASLDAAYKMTHRGPGHIGSYLYTPMGSRGALITADSPYMCELDEGVLESLCERFKPKGSLWVRVAHKPGGCRKKEGASCTYEISW